MQKTATYIIRPWAVRMQAYIKPKEQQSIMFFNLAARDVARGFGAVRMVTAIVSGWVQVEVGST